MEAVQAAKHPQDASAPGFETVEDVKDHIKRLEKMRKYSDLRGDKRTFLGAVAGAVMTDNVKKYVLKQGFFVIEPSGENFNIIPPNGQPKEW
jgi:hypothetical protein